MSVDILGTSSDQPRSMVQYSFTSCHGNQKARYDGQPRTAISTLTQLLNSAIQSCLFHLYCINYSLSRDTCESVPNKSAVPSMTTRLLSKTLLVTQPVFETAARLLSKTLLVTQPVFETAARTLYESPMNLMTISRT